MTLDDSDRRRPLRGVAREHDHGARHRVLFALRAPHAAVLRAGARGVHAARPDHGLSKAARVVDMFARRLQVQERLTDQIANAIMDVLAAARRRGGHRGIPPLHDDARGREAELAHRDQRAPGHLPRRPETRAEFLRLAQAPASTSERSGRAGRRSSPAHPAASVRRRRPRLCEVRARRVVRVARSLATAGPARRVRRLPLRPHRRRGRTARPRLTISAEWGVPDIVVSNAGAFHPEALHETTQDDFDAQLAINLRAPLASGAGAAAADACGGARVPSSPSGAWPTTQRSRRTRPMRPPSSGCAGLHETLLAEYRGTGLRLSLLSPGPTDTGCLESGRPGSCAAPAQSRQHASTRRCGRRGALRRHPAGARSGGLAPARPGLGKTPHHSLPVRTMTLARLLALWPSRRRRRSPRSRVAAASRFHRLGRARAHPGVTDPSGRLSLGRHLRPGDLRAHGVAPRRGDQHPAAIPTPPPCPGLRPCDRLRAARQVWYGTVGNGWGLSLDGGNTWQNWTFTQLGPEWQYVAPAGIVIRGDTALHRDGRRRADDERRRRALDRDHRWTPWAPRRAVPPTPRCRCSRASTSCRYLRGPAPGSAGSTLRRVLTLAFSSATGSVAASRAAYAGLPAAESPGQMAGARPAGSARRATPRRATTRAGRLAAAGPAAAPKTIWFQRPDQPRHNSYIDQTYRYGSTMGGIFQPHQGVEFNNPDGTPVHRHRRWPRGVRGARGGRRAHRRHPA